MDVKSEATTRDTVFLALTSRHGIFLFNVLLIALIFLTLAKMLPMILNTVQNVAELEDISEYMGVILIGYGVAVEERHSFMEIFNLYPRFATPLQERVDHSCHKYGLCYLVLGLFMEMCVACIKIPNSILNTEQLEYLIFGFSFVFLAGSVLLMIRHSWRLLRAHCPATACH